MAIIFSIFADQTERTGIGISSLTSVNVASSFPHGFETDKHYRIIRAHASTG